MNGLIEDTMTVYANYDPTHTTSLRNQFSRDMKHRFQELQIMIRDAIVTKDCFGLKRDSASIYQLTPINPNAFRFLRDPAKIDEFMKWLKEQQDKGLLQVGEYQQLGTGIEGAWTNKYIIDAYRRGVIRARQELKKAGYDVPPLGDMVDTTAIFGLPMHLDRVGLLFTRVFSDLQGVTSQMDSTISRILSQGMIDGDGPALLARKILASIDGAGLGKLGLIDKLGRFIPAKRRAMMIARTEIIRAHAEAQLQEFRNWGVLGVSTKAEWLTAGDERVCEECASREGKVYSLDEASGLIPFHPMCRCCWLPVINE
jgi:SPP1 gp7 family putative phage head morphogenesis protein